MCGQTGGRTEVSYEARVAQRVRTPVTSGSRKIWRKKKNIEVVHMHKRMTVNGVLKDCLKKGDLQRTEIDIL